MNLVASRQEEKVILIIIMKENEEETKIHQETNIEMPKVHEEGCNDVSITKAQVLCYARR